MDIEKRMGEASMCNMAAIQMATFWLIKPITLERQTEKYCFKHGLEKKARQIFIYCY